MTSREDADFAYAIRLSEELNGPATAGTDLEADEEFARRLQANDEDSDCEIVACHTSTTSEPSAKRARLSGCTPVADGKESVTFRLLRTEGLSSEHNAETLQISDIVEGDIKLAVVANYMIDPAWLLSACPVLTAVPRVVVFHGSEDISRMGHPETFELHKPLLPIAYGTHHSKMGAWVQDFPLKPGAVPIGMESADSTEPQDSTSLFEDELVEYMAALGWRGTTWQAAGVTQRFAVPDLRRYDFSGSQ
eukprot:gene15251-18038_t